MNADPRPLIFFGTTSLDLCISVERLPRPGQLVLGTFAHHAGGKGANQAVAAASLGVTTLFCTRLSADSAGEFLRRSLEAKGVIVHSIETAESEKNDAAVVAVDASGSNFIIMDRGANGNIPIESLHLALLRIPQGAIVVIEMGLPLPAIEYLFSQKQQCGFELVFNPAPVKEGLSRRAWQAVDIVTANETEASQLTGIGVHDVETAAWAGKVLLEMGPRAVVITLGSKGAYYCDAREAFMTPAFPVVAIDTTGAGDAFNGGLAASIAQGLPIQKAMVCASAVAAHFLTCRGAQVAMPTAAAINDFLNLVHPSIF